ncbi:hypothetical protein RRF57_009109 [Xylaria bambusicola]|uniref:Uncharacterized protein n=1 Tax=Xylaria bambusicola TaxID=326684 RepID=A0AAN7ZBS7_9PEZI
MDIGGGETRAIDDGLSLNSRLLACTRIAYRKPPALAARDVSLERLYLCDGGIERRHAAHVLELALQGDHEPVRIDDARGRALEDSRVRPDSRLGFLRLARVNPARGEAQDVAADGVKTLEGLTLGVVLRDDPLADVRMSDAAGRAEGVQLLLALDAEASLEGSGAVV